ncbi:MAG: zf-HC2 domain-containing protein [Candidatus Wallbacteria bacterium]|nr:zf-HC2 domain-containing protein [Candidatus Wallbacteria bacterium]
MKTDCTYYESLLSALVDDELGRSERASVESHLAECRQCAFELQALRALVGELREMPRRETGPDYLIGLRKRIDRGDQPEGRSLLAGLSWFRVNLALGAAVAGAVGLVAFQSGSIRDAARQTQAMREPVSDVGMVNVAARVSAKTAAEPVKQAPAEPQSTAAAANALDARGAPAGAAGGGVPLGKAERREDAFQVDAKRAPESPSPSPVAAQSVQLKAAAPASRAAAGGVKRDGAVAALVEAKPAARKAVSTSVDKLSSEKERDLAPAFSADEAASAVPKSGLAVGSLSDAAPAGAPLARPGPAAPQPSNSPLRPPADKDSTGASADAAEEATATPPVTPELLRPEAEVTPEGGGVTHEALAHYLGSRVLSSPEVAVRSRPEATVLLKVTKLHAFLRALREKADELAVADVIETSSASFELSTLASGGKDGLEALGAKMAAMPGAQLSGLMFEKVSEKGQFACRVMVTVEGE